LLLSGSLEPLPWQTASQEIHEHVPESLEVISPALLNTEVGIDGRIPRRPGQVLVLAVRYVLMRLWVSVLLCEAKINAVDEVGLASEANEEIVWLDVTVDETLVVDVLNALQQLVGDHENRLQVELPVAEVEKVLQ